MIETEVVQCSENPQRHPKTREILDYENNVVIQWRDKAIVVLKAWQTQVGISFDFDRSGDPPPSHKAWEDAAAAAIQRWVETGKITPDEPE